MKHIAAIQSEFAKKALNKEAAKWDDLSLEEQRGYLQRHPKSKRKLTGKPDKGKKTKDLKKKVKEKKVRPQNLAKLLPTKNTTKYDDDNLSWSKRGGYAGEKQIQKFVEKITDAGWKKYDTSSHNTPDGSVMGSGTFYISPDKRHIARTNYSYGVTASSNSYSISIKRNPEIDNDTITALVDDLTRKEFTPSKDHLELLSEFGLKSVNSIVKYLKGSENRDKMEIVEILTK